MKCCGYSVEEEITSRGRKLTGNSVDTGNQEKGTDELESIEPDKLYSGMGIGNEGEKGGGILS